MHILLHMQIGGRKKEHANMGGLEATLLQAYAGRERDTSVLVAAMSAREGQRPAASEPATARAVARCLELLGHAVEANGGRVVRSRGSELMAVFATADAAAAAAARVQHDFQRIVPDGALDLRTAFHSGPVRQRGHDIYGDTVNLTAALASRARPGQILTSDTVAAGLGAEFRHALRSVPLPAKDTGCPAAELDWHRVPLDVLQNAGTGKASCVRVTYRYNTLVRRRHGDSITMGRDPDCDLCVDMRLASRRHCTLERRGDKVLLRDHSTNGTFVTLEGSRERRIRAEEIVLQGRGWLSFGVSRLLAEELVQFHCE
jgi:adenylate cyclase